MASPAYVNIGAGSTSAGATSRNPGLPASRSNGNLLIAICASKNNATHTWSGTGWVKFDQVDSGASFTVSLAYRIVDGAEAAPTASWSGSVAAAAAIVQWSGTDGGNPFDGAHNSNTGSSTTHSVSEVTTTRADSRVIYIDWCAVATELATPSGWTENSDLSSVTPDIERTVGGKNVAASGSGAGNISVTGGNAAWVMWQIELRSPASGNRRRRALLLGAI